MTDDRPFEEKIAIPSGIVVTDEDQQVLEHIKNPLLRNCTIKLIELKRSLGDTEAYTSMTATEVVHDLMAVDQLMRFQPWVLVSNYLLNTATTVADALEIVKVINTDMSRVIDDIQAREDAHLNNANYADVMAVFQVMVTGHRDIKYPYSVRDRLKTVLTKLPTKMDLGQQEVFGIVGGAVGADQLFGEACIEATVRFDLYMPNWAYELNYKRKEDLTKLRASGYYCGTRFSVEREQCDDWSRRWRFERWWTDNFKRNDAMIKAADLHIAVCNTDPRRVIEDRSAKGGTANAIKSMYKAGIEKILWIDSSTGDDSAVSWITIN